MRTSLALAATLAVLFFGDASAQQVYRCPGPSGKIQFSDAPCSADLSNGKVSAKGNSVDSSGSRELILRQENERLREELADQKKAAAVQQRTPADVQAERIDSVACERAKRDYEVTASSKFNSASIIEAKRSMMYGTCGMQEPTRNTTIINSRIIAR